MLHGSLAEDDIEKILRAWQEQGETSQQLFVGATLLRKESVAPFLCEQYQPLADNCGTGGSGYAKFNVSTTAAIVAACNGVSIAKHGNRSASGRCGSADLLFRAGYPESLAGERLNHLLERFGLCFIYAPNFHPILKKVAPIRKRMGIRTIFNLLGPLVNPINPQIQLLGVSHQKYLRPMAESIQKLGVKKALVVCSRDGLDEISPAELTDGYLVAEDGLKEITIDPRQLGMSASLKTIEGGDVETNYKLFLNTLNGEPGSAVEAVSLNAGALLWLCGVSGDLKSGAELATESLCNGSAIKYFNQWIESARHGSHS